jgi:hypothetical protein
LRRAASLCRYLGWMGLSMGASTKNRERSSRACPCRGLVRHKGEAFRPVEKLPRAMFS